MSLSLTKEQLEKSLKNNLTKKEVMEDLNISWNQLRYNLDKYKLKLKLSDRIKDERGNKYGKLTVIDLADRLPGELIKWKCKCNCGNEVIMLGTELRRTRYEHMCADCQKKKVQKMQYKNHKGEKHGKLTVIKETKRDKKTGNIYWLCQCDCGNQIEVISYRLNFNTSSEALSCGCLESSGEYYLNLILNKYNIHYKSQYTFNDCRSSSKNSLYKFDFAIFDKENKNLLFLIEYNGKQHYEVSSSGWNTKENHQLTIKRDKEKYKYCENNNIPLLIIPYTKNTIDLITDDLIYFINSNNFQDKI